MKLVIAKYLFVLSFVLLGVISVNAMSLQFQSVYEDSRFEPANILHAGCLNSADILLDADDGEYGELSAELEYDSDDLDILRVESELTDFEYELNYDNIMFSKKNIEVGVSKLFRLYFKSDNDLTWTVIRLVIGDNVQEIDLLFASVPECMPDVIPPTIRLISPENGAGNISLDSSFIFDLKDNGKWIDKKTIHVYLDGILYDNDSRNLDWSGSQVVLYPDEWLPVGQELTIDVSIADKQKYGWANEVKKQFRVVTSTGVLLDSAIEPEKLRGLLQGTLLSQGSSSECALLQKIYMNSNIYYQYKVRKILNKLSCEIPDDEDLIWRWVVEVWNDNVDIVASVDDVPIAGEFSVFCILGWMLFVITLILKMYYFVSHKKYKRKEKKIRKKK